MQWEIMFVLFKRTTLVQQGQKYTMSGLLERDDVVVSHAGILYLGPSLHIQTLQDVDIVHSVKGRIT